MARNRILVVEDDEAISKVIVKKPYIHRIRRHAVL